MRIIARKALTDFAEMHQDAKVALEAWWHLAKGADWKTPRDIKKSLPKASIVADNRVIFNICGSHYRLVVKFNYSYGIGYIRFIGSHRDYDKIDVTRV